MYCEECRKMSRNDRSDGPYRIVNETTGEAVESHPCEHLAERARVILQEHSDRNGGTSVYRVVHYQGVGK